MPLTSQAYSWQYRFRQWLVGRGYALRRRIGQQRQCEGEPERVLVIVAGLLGDSVMSTPLLVEARRAWPDARITLLGQRHNCELLAACPHLDACFETPAVPFTLRQRRKIVELKTWLASERFDVAIIALGDQFAAVLAEAGIPVRVGVAGTLLAPCLTHTYDIGSPRTWGPSQRLNALRALGVAASEGLPQVWVAESARQTATTRLEELGLSAEDRFAVLHPFGSARRQWWPLENVKPTADALHGQHGLKTILIGGPETRGLLPAIDDHLIDATGCFSIEELLAVIDRADVAVSTDSGPFHIAGALGRPLVGLFRASRPEHAGRYPQARVVVGEEPSCVRRCRWDHCQASSCRQLATITAAHVLALVEQILGQDRIQAGKESNVNT